MYLVATPIGNLKDLTLRAREILGSAPLVAAEDTRHTLKLLSAHGIRTRMVSFHAHNERSRLDGLMDHLRRGQDLALVTDSGMPGVSDPGFLLVRAAVEAAIPVVPIPGPCAAVTALAASGLPCDCFYFEGFLPSRGAARRRRLAQLAAMDATMIFYESPIRLVRTLTDAIDMLGGERRAVVAREMTKIHEEFSRGSLDQLCRDYSTRAAVRGECVLLIEGNPGR